jgi:hypothetical protein
MNSQVKKIHFLKKMANWDSTHRRKSADIIDPVQKQKFREKQKNEQIKDSEIRKRRNRKIEIQINEICQKAT